MQSPGNHQMKREPEVVLDADYYALPDSPQFAHRTAFHTRQRRLRGSQQKGAVQPYVFQRLADYARFERADIGQDIRQFWHGYQLARRRPTLAT
jgi:hypothetical protein